MISAIVLAAGQSTRMGQPKMLLKWGNTTVIGKVVSTIIESGIDHVIVVAGKNIKDLKPALIGHQVNFVINPDTNTGDMLSSVKVGLLNVPNNIDIVLIVLGDQPQIESSMVREIITRYESTGETIIVPSYRMHRGHPWLVYRVWWNSILNLQHPATLRDFLNQNQKYIGYINIDNPNILEDLDTPADYTKYRP